MVPKPRHRSVAVFPPIRVPLDDVSQVQELLRDLDRRIRLSEVNPTGIDRPRRRSWPIGTSTADGHPATTTVATATAATGTSAPAPSSGALTASSVPTPLSLAAPSTDARSGPARAAFSTAAPTVGLLGGGGNDGGDVVEPGSGRNPSTAVVSAAANDSVERFRSLHARAESASSTQHFDVIGGNSARLAAGRSDSDSNARPGSVLSGATAPVAAFTAALGGVPSAASVDDYIRSSNPDTASVSPAMAIGSDCSVVVLPSDGFSSADERGSATDAVDVFYEAREGDGEGKEGTEVAEMTTDEEFAML